jgi:hypothetical protein
LFREITGDRRDIKAIDISPVVAFKYPGDIAIIHYFLFEKVLMVEMDCGSRQSITLNAAARVSWEVEHFAERWNINPILLGGIIINNAPVVKI